MTKMLGRYEIVRRLGQGGQAVVYEAVDTELGRRVALKVLLPGARSDEAVARLLREARAAAKLKHPNIVSVYDVGEVGPRKGRQKGQRYLAMELVEGRSLQSALDRREFSVREAVSVAYLVARAAHHAHSHDIVHRDIKPANVLLADDGTPKLTDFGFALDASEHERLTLTGTTMGTPAYMAPEQARGESRDIDARTDVYAIGALLYKILAGRPPFAAETALELLRKAAYETPRPPSDFRAAMPSEADTICLKCLEKDPRRRYQTAGELAEDARRLLERGFIQARPAGIAYRARTAVMRHKAAAAAAVLALAACLGLEVQTQTAMARHRSAASEVAADLGDARKAVLASRQEATALRTRITEVRDESTRLREELARLGREIAARADRRSDAPGEGLPVLGEGDAAAAPGTERGVSPAAPELSAGRPKPGGAPLRVSGTPGSTKLVDLGGGVTLDMIRVGPGRFMMGEEDIARPDRGPVHKVAITRGFHLGRYEVTQEQYERITGTNPSLYSYLKDPGLPVERVSWEEAREFCRLLSARTGGRFRLPTEAEWEYACRAGSTGKYCFGDEGDLVGDYAWYVGMSAGRPHTVGRKLPNAWGFHDMHGNVGEWCSDRHDAEYYAASPREDPVGPDTGARRVFRGGSYLFDVGSCRSSSRSCAEPGFASSMLGFRVVLESVQVPAPPAAAPPEGRVGEKPGRAPGFFVEAEHGASDAKVAAVKGASRGRALRDINTTGCKIDLDVAVSREVPQAKLALRVRAPKDSTFDIILAITEQGQEEPEKYSYTFQVTGAGGLEWWTAPLYLRLPAGRYWVHLLCPLGRGGADLDMLGIVPGAGPEGPRLPNKLVGGRLEEDGYYIEVGMPKIAPLPPRPGLAKGPPPSEKPPAGGAVKVPEVVPVSMWRRVEGAFVEAESGVKPEEEKDRIVWLGNVSDDKAVKDFNVSGSSLSVELVLRRGAADAYLVYRYIRRLGRDGPDPAGHNVWVTVTSLRSGRMVARKHVSHSYAGSRPMWVWMRLGAGLAAGRYRVGLHCERGGGGSAIDVIGIVPGTELERGWLPNDFSRRERRFQERGFYIEVTPVIRAPRLPDRSRWRR